MVARDILMVQPSQMFDLFYDLVLHFRAMKDQIEVYYMQNFDATTHFIGIY